MKNVITKTNELKTGMRLTFDNGEKYIVYRDAINVGGQTDYIVSENQNYWASNCLIEHEEIIDMEIVNSKVILVETTTAPYHNKPNYTPIWEYQTTKEMTIADLEEELGYSIKVVKE